MGTIYPSLLAFLLLLVTCYGKALFEQKQTVSETIHHRDHGIPNDALKDSKFQGAAKEAASVQEVKLARPADLTESWQVGETIKPYSGPRRKHGEKQRPLPDALDETGNDDELEADDSNEFFDNDILSVDGTPQLMANDQEDDRVEKTDESNEKDTFHPVKMPTKFESYDLMPADGFITLAELVNVTGARVNVRLAFNDSDTNGDGRLDRTEFYSAPWKLNPNYPDVSIDTDDMLQDEDDSIIDMDDLFGDDLDDNLDLEEWEDAEDYWNDMDDADVF